MPEQEQSIQIQQGQEEESFFNKLFNFLFNNKSGHNSLNNIYQCLPFSLYKNLTLTQCKKKAKENN